MNKPQSKAEYMPAPDQSAGNSKLPLATRRPSIHAADESFSIWERQQPALANFEPEAAAFVSFLVEFASTHRDLKRICQFLAFLASHFFRNQYGIAAIGLQKEPKKVIRDAIV
ncbi:hypothetical protein [Rhizobium tropici]|uniref:Uncharacterized protein n=3 Tax=Rhizobium/Agrobacterium group TaxID=227290 RepID=A0A6P1C536_RHITR|nr:hypothetical protein [Rhizobium tropici]NEV10084.1 hypothetical protein [Rhizobium tropici]